MSAELSLGAGLNKQYAVVLPKPGQENPEANGEAVKVTKEPERTTSLKWETAVDDNKGKKHIGLSQPDTAVVSSVVLPTAIKAPEQAPALRRHLTRLKKRFVDLFKKSYGNSFHFNRLIAKVAEFTASINASVLMRAGMSPKDVQTLREEVRQDLITQNQGSLAQMHYDWSMLEVLG
ncbi:MAG: hypothetical protein U9R38_02380 [Candidatus Margulisiibacteriota bacterium]|nr:hypothetical protein [Candidatus Margulisiibacteriota bacterium]